MKKTIILTLILGVMTAFAGNAQKSMDKFFVQVDGLGCPFCAYGLEKKFKEFKGIKKVKIDIETGDFSFEYPTEKALTMEAVVKQVEKAGYTPITSRIERADGSVEASEVAAEVTDVSAEVTSEEITVAGNCGMCEARITKAAKSVPGVVAASWDKDSKLLNVQFNPAKASLDTVEKAIAKAGHDTENHKAAIETYNNLPACCHYERIQ